LASAPSVRAIDWLEGANLFGFVRTRILVFSPYFKAGVITFALSGFSLGSQNFETIVLERFLPG
jgi:hypothetical protein